MSDASSGSWRYFLSYSGVTLPLALIGPLDETDLRNRNTYFRARYDEANRMVACEKMVYGDIQLSHRYHYRADGGLAKAEISMDDETTVVEFDTNGRVLPT